jgi:hypothetical protein
MIRVTTKRALDAHYDARHRRMALRSLWRDLKCWLPRLDLRRP